MQYLQEINLDLNSNTAYTTVGAKQGDQSSRVIKIHITSNGADWPIPGDATVSYRVRKPDGYAVWNEATVPSPNPENVVYIELTEQALAVPGRAYADLLFVRGVGAEKEILSTVSFIIIIMASPDVIENIVSGNEFGELIDLTNNANTIINESEAWATGMKASEPVAGDYFEYHTYGTEDLYYNIDSSVFRQYVGINYGRTVTYTFTCTHSTTEEQPFGIWQVEWEGKKRESILTATPPADRNIPDNTTYYMSDYGFNFTDGTALQSNVIQVIVTDREIYFENNAKYYAEQAENSWNSLKNLNVTATTVAHESGARIETSEESGVAIWSFYIPQGIAGDTGLQGENTVWVSSSSAPPSDGDWSVWLDPEGTTAPILLTASQMTYSSVMEYGPNTVGEVISAILSSMDYVNIVAASASMAADRADRAASSIEGAIASIDEKITCPTNFPENTGYLKVTALYTEDEEPTIAPVFSWQSQLDYNNDLYNLPSINGVVLANSLSLDDLNIAPKEGSTVYYVKPSDGIPPSDFTAGVRSLLSLASNSVQRIKMNDELYTPDSGLVDLGFAGIQTIIMNGDQEYTPASGIVDLGRVLKDYDNTNIGPNYLDNPWFTINQRKITSYNGESTNIATTSTYVCDRWKIIEDELPQSRTITIGNGIAISSASNFDPTKSFSIGQVIDNDTWESLSNRDVTYSINYSFDGATDSTFLFNFNCPNYGQATDVALASQLDPEYGWGLYVDAKAENDEVQLRLSVLWAANVWGSNLKDTPIYIKKTKLELGNQSTLDLEAQPRYNTELQKCQRYLKVYGAEPSATSQRIIIGSGKTQSATLIDWEIDFNEPMIKNPKISSTVDLNVWRNHNSGGANVGVLSTTNLAASSYTAGVGNLYLTTTTAGLSGSAVYWVSLPPTTTDSNIAMLTFSAEP